MAILTSLFLFLILMTAISIFGYRRWARPGRVFEQIGPAEEFHMPAVDRTAGGRTPLAVRIIQKIGETLPLDAHSISQTRRDLIAAGYRTGQALAIYLGIRVLACAALVALVFPLRGMITANPVFSVVLVVAAGFIGFFLPSLFLDHVIAARHDRIRRALPDTLDLLVICVEAGFALDQAIQYVGRELMRTYPDLSQELNLVNLEIAAGRKRVEALHNLAERTREPELGKLVAILIQTDRFGTSIAESLRTHSDFMRVRRRQEAEERAGKVGVKLVFPIFFLILPAMLVVAAGPGLLQVFRYLFPLMGQHTF